MCLIQCEIVDGGVSFEKLVRIQTVSGVTEELSAPNELVEGSELRVHEIGRNGKNVLIELPREAASGALRIWVPASIVTEGRSDDSHRSRDTCRA